MSTEPRVILFFVAAAFVLFFTAKYIIGKISFFDKVKDFFKRLFNHQ